jgi:alpha-glucosidase
MSFGADYCADGLHFHGVMDYWFRSAVLGWFDGSVTTRAFTRAVGDYYVRYGHEASLRSWNVLSTHDTPRLRSILPDAADRELAVILQFTLPGEPVVYYGEENGMEGGPDPDNRRPMQWAQSSWDQRTRAFYRKIGELCAIRRELREGRLILLDDYLDPQARAIAYIRHTEVPNQESLVVVNRGETVLEQRLLLPHTQYFPTLRLTNLLAPDATPDQVECRQGSVQLRLPAKTAAIYVPVDNAPNYSFFKPRMLGPNWP